MENEPLIVVNIPAFELWALDPTQPDHRIALEMRVVVGKAVNKQTPAFRGDMRYVIMSPYWNVPYSIAVNEMLPRLANEPDYLETRNLELVREFSWDAEVLPATDENIAAVRAGRVNIRQQPGPQNSLGSAKFIFPNSDNVYLHDTGAQHQAATPRQPNLHRIGPAGGRPELVPGHQHGLLANRRPALPPHRADQGGALLVDHGAGAVVAADRLGQVPARGHGKDGQKDEQERS